jgi:acyl carrier protein
MVQGGAVSPTTLERVIKVLRTLESVSPDQVIAEDTPLVGTGIGLDSVAVLELLLGLEKEFEIEVSADDLRRASAVQTVGSLARFLASKTGSAC